MAYATKPKESSIRSFPPVTDHGAIVLILGSMPGQASLDAGEYYAHKHNQFWRIMGELTGAMRELPYETRLNCLKKSGIALWDVLETCTRPGSLDSAITDEKPNSLPQFLERHKSIRLIGFNGRKAEECCQRHFPQLIEARQHRFLLLPSTSPAHASMTYEQKLESWKTILR